MAKYCVQGLTRYRNKKFLSAVHTPLTTKVVDLTLIVY